MKILRYRFSPNELIGQTRNLGKHQTQHSMQHAVTPDYNTSGQTTRLPIVCRCYGLSRETYEGLEGVSITNSGPWTLCCRMEVRSYDNPRCDVVHNEVKIRWDFASILSEVFFRS